MTKTGARVFGKFSSFPIYKAMSNDKKWVLRQSNFVTSGMKGTISKTRNKTLRQKVRFWSFEYIGDNNNDK